MREYVFWELLAVESQHCKKRGTPFQDAKNVKRAIEDTLNIQRENDEKIFYYLNITK